MFTLVSLVLCWPVQYDNSVFIKVAIIYFLSGVAKLAFSDENVGFNSGFFKIISSTGSRQRKIETDVSTVTHFSNIKSTKWQEQQITVNPASTFGPSSMMMIELSNICVVFLMWLARVTNQHSATIRSS